MDNIGIGPNLKCFNLPSLFTDTLGWDRSAYSLSVTTAVLGVASPRALDFNLTAIAQKRGVQVYLCPPNEYGFLPNQTTRRLIQDQVALSAYHNVVIYTDAIRNVQVWQWAVRQAGGYSTRIYEHYIGNEAQALGLLSRLTALQFTLNDEDHLTLLEVVRRLQTAFADDHAPIQRGRHGRAGLRVYELAEMEESIRYWWERVLKEPDLTREKEYSVACAMKRGDSHALDVLVRSHLHLIARITWRIVGGHRCAPTDYLDLVQTANLEMIRLAPGFDPESGMRFQTYLTPRIQKTLKRILSGEEGLIPLPRYLLDALPKIDERRASVEDRMARCLGRMPFEEEILEQLSTDYQVQSESIARVLLIQDGILSFDLLTVQWQEEEDAAEEANDNQHKGPMVEFCCNYTQSPSEAAINLIRREQLDAVLNKLSPRERDVVRVRFGLEDGYAHTLEEVGQRFLITRERVRQIELRALKKLRRMEHVDIRDKPTGAKFTVLTDCVATPLQDNESADDPEIFDGDCDAAI